jgi:CHAD domain-containing protein
MKHKELAREIRQRFQAIEKLAKKSTPDFDQEVVHDLRLEVKKLRAFLRLVNTEAKHNGVFKIRKKLKNFYRHTGAIRNIQLHLHYVTVTLPPGNYNVDPYLQILHTELDEWKKEAADTVPTHADLNKDKSMVLDALPAKLPEESIRKFEHQRAAAVSALMAVTVPTAEDIHSLRKELKDIQYTWPYIKAAATEMLPPGLHTQENIRALTDVLGSYYDKHTALEFLQPVYINAVTSEEGKKQLLKMRDQVEKEMLELSLQLKS